MEPVTPLATQSTTVAAMEAREAQRPTDFFPLPPPAAGARHVARTPPFPNTFPKKYTPKRDNVIFDPKVHLAQPIGVPSYIKVLRSDPQMGKGCVKLVEVSPDADRPPNVEDLAHTAPFRVLSDEGVRAFRQIIADNEDELAIRTPRNPKLIRGLGYRSRFVRDFNESPELVEHLSRFANVDVAAHPMTTNYSQINFGEPPAPGSKEAVPADLWHLDSVDYVLVVMLSEGFEGGELLVSNMDPNEAMKRIKADNLPDELTSRIRYTQPGFAVFMQGSRIAHAVAPVTGGTTARISMVNSYVSRDSLRVDRPWIYNGLAQNHSKEDYNPDYLRHMSWRCMAKLEQLVAAPSFDDPEEGEQVLDLVIEQLCLTRRLMRGEEKHAGPVSETVELTQGSFVSLGSKSLLDESNSMSDGEKSEDNNHSNVNANELKNHSVGSKRKAIDIEMKATELTRTVS